MILKKTFGVAMAIASLTVFTLVACKKDTKTTDAGTEPAENNSLAESNYNDVTVMVDLAVTNGNNMTFRTSGAGNAAREGSLLGSSCLTVTLDTVSTPRTVTIDFGTTNCLGLDGRNRRGKIIASYTGRYRDAGTVVNITFNNYYVNENQIKGTHTVTNMGNNAAGHPVYKVEVNGQIVKANSAGTITWTSTRQREWTEGYTTLNPLDDVYAITGTAEGTTIIGTSYTINITQALVRKMNCRWIESGKIDITPQGQLKRTVDYGNTGCDANASVTIGGVVFPIVLP